MPQTPLGIAVLTIPALLIAVILHEIAHGWAADKLGDPTARLSGRITLNPLKHIDPFLTIIVPGVLVLSGSPVVFGGAKPVPVNPLNLRNPRKDMIWVALAGPITNIVLALSAYAILKLGVEFSFFSSFPRGIGLFLYYTFAYAVLINLVLALFNMLPIPPLDGGRIAVGLLPAQSARALAKLEPFGILIVVALLFFGLFDVVITPILEFLFTHVFT